MRRLRRWLFNLAAAGSLVLCAAMIVLWVWSYNGQVDGGLRIGYVSNFPFGAYAAENKFPITINGYAYVLTTPRGGAEFYWQEIRTKEKPLGVGSMFADVEETFLGFGIHRAPGKYPSASGRWADQGTVRVPFWFLFCLSLVLPAWWLLTFTRSTHLRRRLARGLCPNCGYDLRATPDRCPECGAVPEAVKRAAT